MINARTILYIAEILFRQDNAAFDFSPAQPRNSLHGLPYLHAILQHPGFQVLIKGSECEISQLTNSVHMFDANQMPF